MPTTHIPENDRLRQPPAEADSGLTYCLVHGSWHGAWCWDLLKPRLEAYGHHAIAVDVPIDEAYATVDDWTDEVCRVIDDAPNTLVVGHSRMSNLLPRVAEKKNIRQAVYITPGFDASNDDYFQQSGLGPMPRKYWFEDFDENVLDHPDNPGLKIFNPKKAREIFYNDCLPEVADWALENMRPMYRPEIIEAVEVWPEVPSTVIIGDSDRVINPEYSRYVAKSIGARIVEMSGGHSLFLSQPERIAQTLHKLALCDTVSVKAC